MKSSKKIPDLSIILPARNEAELLPRIIPDIINYCKHNHLSSELIVVLNGCTDNSRQILKKYDYKNLKVIFSDPGYGKALRQGLKKATGRFIAIYNADFYDNRLLDLAKIDLYGKDFIIGSKMAPWSKDFRPFSRKLISFSYNFLLKVLYGFSGSDTHGIKLLRQEIIKKVLPLCQTDTGIFDTEFVIRAQRLGFKIADFPVTVKEIRPPRFKSRLIQTPQDLFKLHNALQNNTDKTLFYDSVADTWENFINNKETNKRINVVFNELLKDINLNNKKLLEVGCGLGYFIKKAHKSGAKIYGIDIGKNLVEKCSKTIPGKYKVGSATDLPYSNNTFDIVICTEVLEHTHDPIKGVTEIIRVIKPGGFIVLTTPNKLFKPLFNLLSTIKVRPYQGIENWLSVPNLRQEIVNNKGIIVKQYHFNFLYPHQLLDKLENKYPFNIFTINQGYLITK